MSYSTNMKAPSNGLLMGVDPKSLRRWVCTLHKQQLSPDIHCVNLRSSDERSSVHGRWNAKNHPPETNKISEPLWILQYNFRRLITLSRVPTTSMCETLKASNGTTCEYSIDRYRYMRIRTQFCSAPIYSLMYNCTLYARREMRNRKSKWKTINGRQEKSRFHAKTDIACVACVCIYNALANNFDSQFTKSHN